MLLINFKIKIKQRKQFEKLLLVVLLNSGFVRFSNFNITFPNSYLCLFNQEIFVTKKDSEKVVIELKKKIATKLLN